MQIFTHISAGELFYQTSMLGVIFSLMLLSSVVLDAKDCPLTVTKQMERYILISGRFHHCKVTRLQAGAFSDVLQTEYLSITYQAIPVIDPGAFSGLENLINLDLQNNQITKLDAGVFNGVWNLGVLLLNNNQIRSVRQ